MCDVIEQFPTPVLSRMQNRDPSDMAREKENLEGESKTECDDNQVSSNGPSSPQSS
jgi:hypothetical protein